MSHSLNDLTAVIIQVKFFLSAVKLKLNAVMLKNC